MADKKVEITLTKYYLYAWVYGLTGLLCFYHHWNVVAFILFFFCFSFSVADFTNPPADNDGGDGPKAA